ncbi:MAG: hypothetical protein FVQ83_04805 [Chloroflexi bacterium]|nr:hypothetical protein [Chloroflexota bacterium]
MSLLRQHHIPETQMHAYLDNALEEAERLDIDTHISTCQLCRQELENLKALFSEIESIPEFRLETDLTPFVIAAIESPNRITTRWRLVLAAQTILALFVIWKAWPMINAEFLIPQIPNISIDLQVVASDINLTTNSIIYSLINPTKEFFLQISGTIFEGSSPVVSTIYLLPLAISATLLWLVGNRVLLKETNHNNFRAHQ